MVKTRTKHRAKIKTKTGLAPRMITYMNLLTVPLIDIEGWLRESYENNPLLEIEFPVDDGSDKVYKGIEGNGNKSIIEEVTPSKSPTLQSHLYNQLKNIVVDDDTLEYGLILIGEMDEDGLLKRTVSDVAGEYDVDENKLEKVLVEIIQGLTPTGVGARDRAELYRLQLTPEQMEDGLLLNIINNYLDNLLDENYYYIADELLLDVDEVIKYNDIIKGLNDKPGYAFHSDEDKKNIIIPDLIIEEIEGELQVRLNEERFPDVSINEGYLDMIKKSELSKSERGYVNDLYINAKGLLFALEMRAMTLLMIGKLIIDEQREFFSKGIDVLKPMTLSLAAEKMDISISTVSRATSGKYVRTSFGILPLRFFFSVEIDNKSRTTVFFLMREIIEGEEAPLTDREIVEELRNRDVSISRRTVAKYRERMGIPSSHKRRKGGKDEV